MAETKKRGRPTKKELEAKRIAEEKARRAEESRFIKAVALMGAGALFAALAFVPGESWWNAVHGALFGLFGLLAYLLGPVLIMLGVAHASRKNISVWAAARWGVMALSASAASYVFSLARPSASTAWGIVKELFRMGKDRIGTGLLSAMLGWPLEHFMGPTGAKIIVLVLVAVGIMLVSGKTVVDAWQLVKWPFVTLPPLVKKMIADSKRRKAQRFAEENSLERLRQKEGFAEKAKRIDVPLEDELPRRRSIDIPLDGEPVSFSPEKEKRVAERVEKLPNIDVDLGPDFDPSAEGVELNPTGPAGSVVLDVFGRAAAQKQQEEELFASFDSSGDSQSFAELQEASARFASAQQLLAQAASENAKAAQAAAQQEEAPASQSEVELLARKADSEYLMNAAKKGVSQQQDKQQAKVYRRPPVSLLQRQQNRNEKSLEAELSQNAELLVKTLASFGVNTKVINISRGPAVTRYELQPDVGVRINRIANLADDIALNLAAISVRIEAPIPGKAAVGIEIPNKNVQVVNLRPIIESEEFQRNKGALTFALGKDVSGAIKVGDIEKMPHMLIAGATGMGKSVCINSILVSLLYKYSPDELKLILVDPKMVEFSAYNSLPHLYVPVVTDARKAAGALGWAVSEMMKRYRLFADSRSRNITEYNKYVEQLLADPNYETPDGETEPQKLPRVVIIIDELADLMMVAPNEVEDAIARLAQMARAAGMHLILATQRPSVDVITGVIKNNIPSRIAFAVSSQVDSRTILDGAGAEKLLGRGDMLYMPVGQTKAVRIQGSFVAQEEVEAVVEYIKKHNVTEYDESVVQEIDRQAARGKNGRGGNDEPEDEGDGFDEMFEAAVEVVLDAGQASTSMLQRKLRLGYGRAARIMDEMQQAGIIGEPEGSKPRRVLITKQQWLERVTTQSE